MGNVFRKPGKIVIHPILREAAALFAGEGKQLFLVGGAVRDMLRGAEAEDWDLATDAAPEEVAALFRRGPRKWPVIPTGIRHGTLTVHFRGRSLEITTFRTESAYTDGRRPDRVSYAATIEEDLSRRDLTINAIALELPSGRLVDPFDGAGDIRRALIRCAGNPAERFAEDGLRPLRAVRFASQLGFTVEEPTLAAIPGALAVTARVSPERIRDELEKIIASPKPSTALLLMERTGLLELLLPELSRCRGVEQKGFHRFDVLDHSLLACDYAARTGAPLPVRLAALFHDLGKPLTRKLGEAGVWTFHQHEKESARLCREILLRCRWPNGVIDQVVHLVKEHMFHYDETWGDAAVRRFIIRSGEENLPALYALREADAYGMTGTPPPRDFLLPLDSRVKAVLAQSRALSLKDLAVSGKDLVEIGVQPGPSMGIILGELLEAVLEDPAQNTREKLLEIAGNLNRRYL
jgi:putative nucleotidyltransferase with HDIG domain